MRSEWLSFHLSSHSLVKTLRSLSLKNQSRWGVREQVSSLAAALQPPLPQKNSCSPAPLSSESGYLWEEARKKKWHEGRVLRHGALATGSLLVGLRHGCCVRGGLLPHPLTSHTHQHKLEKSLILYLVQGPLPLMTVDDTPAGRRGNFHLRLDTGRRKRRKNSGWAKNKTWRFFCASVCDIDAALTAFYSTRTSTEYY